MIPARFIFNINVTSNRQVSRFTDLPLLVDLI